jgi:hypothetical protein
MRKPSPNLHRAAFGTSNYCERRRERINPCPCEKLDRHMNACHEDTSPVSPQVKETQDKFKTDLSQANSTHYGGKRKELIPRIERKSNGIEFLADERQARNFQWTFQGKGVLELDQISPYPKGLIARRSHLIRAGLYNLHKLECRARRIILSFVYPGQSIVRESEPPTQGQNGS